MDLPKNAAHDDSVALPGGTWRAWRCACARAPGFPASPVHRLATPGTARAADELLDAERAVVTAKEAVLAALRRVETER
ncbi:MAG TPA: hypothetical protein VLT33_36420, partial [Labilithrix sp.]|nr:hypothetical protein [Labilithrix sp.]